MDLLRHAELSRRAVLAAAALVPLAGCVREASGPSGGSESAPGGASPSSASSAAGGSGAEPSPSDTASGDADVDLGDGTPAEQAARLAGDDPVLLALIAAFTPGWLPPEAPDPEPTRIFDNVTVVGTDFVSATAVETSDGVILIDALESRDQAADILVPELRSLGVDPARIKYVVVAHGHADHFGGAQYLADRYGARVLMSPTDWDVAAADDSPDVPARDLDIADGQKLTLGGTTMTLPYTPGHTPGTVSPVFPVWWKGRRHTAMLWGGTGLPEPTSGKRDYLRSVTDYAALMRRARVDVELSNHAQTDYGLERLRALRDGTADGQNPFVLGRARAQRFMRVLELMVRDTLQA
ncbi:MBL fold metallo-hydrolase [Promicromonospora sukumoe]|uniref:Metallo-beta-lactamase class B n=1 Tax=Promicromonospora sukumoe TaxID=88382 RepID=A0A7W3J6U2_9MICO|nr:MBL fold metallo-hydrolase [Promicromonospora sukumoe]MBA8807381.1 metallo-beta-lactamase class B [Promicromonospora sukumoe]